MKKCLFLDRDGTINKNSGYVYKYENFIWLKNAKKAIQYAYKKNYLIIIISNQSGVSRGYFKKKDCELLNLKINKSLKKLKCKIHKFYYSFYHPKFKKTKFKAIYRKPNAGLFFLAKKEMNINLTKSIMIGDLKSDQIAARKAGVKFRFKRKNLLKEVKSII